MALPGFAKYDTGIIPFQPRKRPHANGGTGPAHTKECEADCRREYIDAVYSGICDEAVDPARCRRILEHDLQTCLIGCNLTPLVPE